VALEVLSEIKSFILLIYCFFIIFMHETFSSDQTLNHINVYFLFNFLHIFEETFMGFNIIYEIMSKTFYLLTSVSIIYVYYRL